MEKRSQIRKKSIKTLIKSNKILHHLSCELMSGNFSMYKHFNNLELKSK